MARCESNGSVGRRSFHQCKNKIKKGVIIEKIDGEAITNDIDWARLLNRKIGKKFSSAYTIPKQKPAGTKLPNPSHKAKSKDLLYDRWVKMNRKKVEEMSGGKVGYVHVQGMNDGSYRTVYEDALGKAADKEALIVDTRFNGGGWLHDDLVTFLGGKKYLAFFSARRTSQFRRAMQQMDSSFYSDHERKQLFRCTLFPYAYKALVLAN